MNKTKKIILALILTATFLFIAIVAGRFAAPLVSYAGQVGTADPFPKYATSTRIWVGDFTPTNVALPSIGRSYLEITNLSGATSTSQTIYCAVGATAVKYSGIAIFATTTKIFTIDNIPNSYVSCLAQTSSSTVSVVER